MSEEPLKKKPQGQAQAGRSQFASSAVKRELERIEQQAMQPGLGLTGSDAASPLSPENVVRAVLGEPHRADQSKSLSKDDKHRSVHDWPIVSPGGR